MRDHSLRVKKVSFRILSVKFRILSLVERSVLVGLLLSFLLLIIDQVQEIF